MAPSLETSCYGNMSLSQPRPVRHVAEVMRQLIVPHANEDSEDIDIDYQGSPMDIDEPEPGPVSDPFLILCVQSTLTDLITSPSPFLFSSEPPTATFHAHHNNSAKATLQTTFDPRTTY